VQGKQDKQEVIPNGPTAEMRGLVLILKRQGLNVNLAKIRQRTLFSINYSM
jgi:hypothetical protein